MSIFQAWFTTESIRFRVRALKALRDQRTEFVAIWRHLRPGDIACDIGANKGSFIYWLSRWVRDGRVVAFEPQLELARYLQRLCRIIGLGNVTVEAKAVYSHSGDRDLFVPEGHGPGASLQHRTPEGRNFTTLSVPVVALDDYFKESDRITLLKIDVEGAELARAVADFRVRKPASGAGQCPGRVFLSGGIWLRGHLYLLQSGFADLAIRCRRSSAPGRRVVLEEQGLLQQFHLSQAARDERIEVVTADFRCWHFSDLARCPTGVRNAHQGGPSPTPEVIGSSPGLSGSPAVALQHGAMSPFAHSARVRSRKLSKVPFEIAPRMSCIRRW
jgi:FkbM family methyltransferase